MFNRPCPYINFSLAIYRLIYNSVLRRLQNLDMAKPPVAACAGRAGASPLSGTFGPSTRETRGYRYRVGVLAALFLATLC